MKILHVSQGLTPFRTGGLNEYCHGLLKEQSKDITKSISLIYPGEYKLGMTRIREGKNQDFKLYEIINPLPLALTFGINSPKRYMKACNSNCYREFFQKNSFDVIHVHCIMGIHLEFFQEARAAGISMVFTTHDYYPLCLNCRLINSEGNPCSGAGKELCARCNLSRGLSRTSEIVMQSDLYRRLKYSSFFTSIRRYKRKSMHQYESKILHQYESKILHLNEINNAVDNLENNLIEEYGLLLDYHKKIIECMNIIHCNSEITLQLYSRFIPGANFKMIPLTDINPTLENKQDHRLLDKKNMNIGYFGGRDRAKGLYVLLEALELLDSSGTRNWSLQLYGGDYKDIERDSKIINHGFYKKEELKDIFSKLDLLVLPSICYETFGLVAAEAITHGVPVVVSDTVGANILLRNCPVSSTFKGGSVEELFDLLMRFMDLNYYNEAAQWCFKEEDMDTFNHHAQRILELYENKS